MSFASDRERAAQVCLVVFDSKGGGCVPPALQQPAGVIYDGEQSSY